MENLIDCVQAGEILGICPKTVKRMAGKGRLPAMKVGRVWRFRETELDSWIAEQLELNCHLRPPVES